MCAVGFLPWIEALSLPEAAACECSLLRWNAINVGTYIGTCLQLCFKYSNTTNPCNLVSLLRKQVMFLGGGSGKDL